MKSKSSPEGVRTRRRVVVGELCMVLRLVEVLGSSCPP